MGDTSTLNPIHPSYAPIRPKLPPSLGCFLSPTRPLLLYSLWMTPSGERFRVRQQNRPCLKNIRGLAPLVRTRGLLVVWHKGNKTRNHSYPFRKLQNFGSGSSTYHSGARHVYTSSPASTTKRCHTGQIWLGWNASRQTVGSVCSATRGLICVLTQGPGGWRRPRRSGSI